MQTRRVVVGAVALAAIVVAAISFAIVDASIASTNDCMSAAASCATKQVPTVAVSFAVLGIVALLVSVVPAVTWIIEAVQLHNVAFPRDGDLELARRHRPRRDPGEDLDG